MSTAHDATDHANTPPTKPGNEGGVPKRIGPYEIQKKIGAGGMGAVFLATDTRLKRQVALKVLPRDKAENPTLVRRFKSEAEKAAQLKHENIIAVYDAGEVDGSCFIALEFVDGLDVHDLVERRGVLPVKRSIDIIKQVARALQHAYEKGIVHRDIKPSNLMIRRDGVVKLADMGLARSIDETVETGITRAGTTVGTVDYMSPEQAKDSKAADVRSDIYSLGCTWYHMLTGAPPFPDGSLTNKLRAHAQTPPPDPRDKNPQVPEGLVAVLHRMLAKNPDDRYATPKALLEDLSSPLISKEAVSQNILAALAEEEGPVTKSAARTGGLPAGPLPLPPKQKGSDAEETTERQPIVSPRLLVTLAIGAAAIVGVMSLGKMVQKYSSAFDTGHGVSQSNPFDMGGSSPPPSNPTAAQAVATPAGTQESTGTATEKATEPKPANAVAAATTGEPQPGAGTPAAATSTAALVRDEDPRQIPKWIDEPLPVTALGRFIVRHGADGKQQVSSLNEAFRRLPPEGGFIELAGNGPFPLRPVQLSQQRVVIRAQPGSRPLIVLVPPAVGAVGALLQLSGGLLELEQVDVAADARQFATSDALALVQVNAGDLLLRNCSLTLRGQRPGRTVAVRLEGRSKSPRNRLLIDQTAIRGANLTGLQLDVEQLDGVLRNSLLVSGAAQLLDLRGNFGDSENSVRTIRVLSSTLSAKANALRLATENAQPVATSLFFLNSLVAAEPGEPRPPLLALEDWPQNPNRTAEEGPFKNLKFQSEATAFLGWKPLIQLNRDDLLKVETPAQWQRLWKQARLEEDFHDGPWPKSAVAQPADVPLKTWLRDTAETGHLKTADGEFPGCSVSPLPTPDLAALSPALAQAYRPLPPLPLVTPQTVKVDLTKQDLGKFLAAQDWPDATVIVASGFGNRTCSPITLNGKLLRIVFEQTPGAPLIITPRWHENSRPPGKDTTDALITLAGGRLELVNGSFQISPQDRQWVPSWLLNATGGDFELRNCRVHAPFLGDSRNRGLIRWSPAPAGSAPPPSGEYQNVAVISDCFLLGAGELISAQLNRQALLLRNSLLVARDEVFALNPTGQAGPPGAALDAEHCTFAAGDAYFKIAGDVGESAARLRLYLSECVYAPHFREHAHPQGPVLMGLPAAALEHKQVEWWEDRCGYAPDITCFLQRGAASRPTDKQDFDKDWKAAWGAPQVQRPLTGNDGVFLKDPLPQRLPLKPANFELHGNSKAFKWGDGGEPIGANLADLEAHRPAPEPKSPKGTSPPKPSPRPSF